MGEIDNDKDDTLGLEEGFKNALLQHQSEVDGTIIFGEDSGRLQPRTLIDCTLPHLKKKSVKQSLRRLTTLFSGLSSPFPQSLQTEAGFIKYMLYPQGSCHSHKTLVVQDKSMGGSLITMIGMM